MHEFALFAGSAAAAIFMISQLPMLIKACRTKNLTSYSFANIGLANVGNVLYAVYVLQVPLGPVWAVHGFNLTTSGLMLTMYLRYGRKVGVTAAAINGISYGETDTGADLRDSALAAHWRTWAGHRTDWHEERRGRPTAARPAAADVD
ncbi:MAG TPA: PQ-loop domain-containing transporter [Microlunatus sp.]